MAAGPFDGWTVEPIDGWGPGSVNTAARRDAAARVMRAFVGTGAGAGVKVDGNGIASPHGAPRSPLSVARFNRVTEGRHVGNAKYSMCGDLVSVVYSLLGCRDERIINRTDDDLDGIADAKQPPDPARGLLGWKVGWTVTMLLDGARKAGCWVPSNEGRLPAQGDAFLCGDNGAEHVGLWEEDPEDCGAETSHNALHEWAGYTVEGGQVDAGGQCIKRYLSYLRRDPDGRLFISRTPGKGGRIYQGHIDLASIPLSSPARLPPA